MPVTSTPSDGFTVGVDTSLTVAHTSDANPLYVFLSWWVATGGTDATDVIDSVEYDGEALTRGGRIAVAGNTMEWWRLSAPPVGTANLVVTLNASRKICAGVINLSGWPTAIADHTFDAEGDDVAPPAVVVNSRVGAEVISWIGFNDEDQDVTAPGGTELWNQEGESVTPGGSTGDQRSAAILLEGAAPSVSVTWTGTITSEWFGVAALSFTDPLGRHLLTGTGHTANGRDNLIAGQDNTINGSTSEAHGQDGTVVGTRSVLFNLDGTPRTLSGDGKFEVYGAVGGDIAAADRSYLTEDDETAVLPNSRRLLAGSGITFDDSVAGERTIEAGAAASTRSIGLSLDGGGSAISAGVKADVYVPFSGTITAVTMLADQSGSIVVDIWKKAYASFPPTVADTITASAKPTITTAIKSQDTTLTSWTTSVSAGDVLRFNVDSATTITKLALSLTVTT